MCCQWKLKLFRILIIMLLLGMTGTASARELTVLVDNWPPYNFERNGTIVGISTELIEAALQKAHIQYKLAVYPFKRALATVQKNTDTMLFTVARIPQREDMFAWIGPLHPRRLYLFKLKNRTDIQINTLKDINKYRTGALAGGSVEQFFIANGIHENNYYLVSDSENLLKLLLKKELTLYLAILWTSLIK